jgi:MGT family glycosyltransferase
MLRPMLPGVPRVVSARSRLVRRFGTSVLPRPAFPATGGLNIAFFPRDFQAPNPRVDETFRFVGPMIDPDTRGGDAPFEITGPDPLVYISLGTLHLGSVDFFRQCFEAFADMPARFLLSVGKQTDLATLGRIPANFVVRSVVPQLAVLQHASVFLTHGGMNSALEALWCAVPLVAIPQQVEQLLIGLTVAARGAGLVLRGHVAGRRVTAAELRAAVERALSEPSFTQAASVESLERVFFLSRSLRATPQGYSPWTSRCHRGDLPGS